MGNIQDKSSFRGPSRAGGGRGGIPLSNWQNTGGCEDAFAVPDPADPDVVWSGCDNGRIVRMDYKTGMARDVSPWPITSYGWAPADMKYRWDWITPLAISPHDHNRVYAGAQVVFMTTNGGQSWKAISPDLTTNTKSHQQNSGGITSDNLTTFDGGDAVRDRRVAGEGRRDLDGERRRTGERHAGRRARTGRTSRRTFPNLPPWGTVWSVAPSHFDAATAYVVVNLQHQADYDARVYKTSDYGATWKLISVGVPKGVNSNAHIVVEDPVRRGMLYLGTDNALYVTWDDGEHWTRIAQRPAAGADLLDAGAADVQRSRDRHARPRRLHPRRRDAAPDVGRRAGRRLPSVRAAPRVSLPTDQRRARKRRRSRTSVGENAQYGADINFSLKSETPDVKVSITGPEQRDDSHAHGRRPPGAQSRVVGPPLRVSGSTIVMQVPPLDEPWAPARRNYAAYGTRIPPAGPIVPPGQYTVHVKAGATRRRRRALTVLPDPHSPGTQQTIEAQVAFVREVLAEIDAVAQDGESDGSAAQAGAGC